MQQNFRRLALLLLLALAAAGLGPLPAAAQETPPPTGDPQPVPPEECQVERRSFDSLPDPSLATPEETPAATPEVFRVPEGTPADESTVEAVTAAIRESLACGNAGDSLRLFSTLTDSYIASLLVNAGLPTMSRAIYDFLATPIAAPVETQIALSSVEDVQVLLDGRVGAVVVTSDTETTRNYVVLVERDGRYLVDRLTPIPEATATPGA